MTKQMIDTPVGTELYSVATGRVSFLNRRSMKAVEYILEQKGFRSMYPNNPHGTLFLFDSLDNAKHAKDKLRAKGIEVGKNICKFRVVSPDEIEYVCDAAKS